MAKVTVLRSFFDMQEKCDRIVGDTFNATNERAEFIKNALPDYVEITLEKPTTSTEKPIKGDETQGAVSESTVTIQELRAEAKSRGITVPRGSSKADIEKLLLED